MLIKVFLINFFIKYVIISERIIINYKINIKLLTLRGKQYSYVADKM